MNNTTDCLVTFPSDNVNNKIRQRKIKLRTERLILRELELEDAEDMHSMDINPEVRKYLGNFLGPTSIEDTLMNSRSIREQYEKHGFGRWAVVEVSTGKFVGWAGLKKEMNVNGHTEFIDLGYRLKPEFWNRGYATEAAKALVEYGFENFNTDKICAYILADAVASQRVVEKAGLRLVSHFVSEDGNEMWFEVHR